MGSKRGNIAMIEDVEQRALQKWGSSSRIRVHYKGMAQALDPLEYRDMIDRFWLCKLPRKE
tara:strand:+ start:319 stop:501 length:183 start_codon:yes stop_codon:yes gene_type:complete